MKITENDFIITIEKEADGDKTLRIRGETNAKELTWVVLNIMGIMKKDYAESIKPFIVLLLEEIFSIEQEILEGVKKILLRREMEKGIKEIMEVIAEETRKNKKGEMN